MTTPLDYICPECGERAVIIEKRVTVVHGRGCPVAARLAELRAQAGAHR